MVGGEVVQFCCIEHFFVAKLFNDVIDEESVLQNSVCVLQFRYMSCKMVLLNSSTWLYTILCLAK